MYVFILVGEMEREETRSFPISYLTGVGQSKTWNGKLHLIFLLEGRSGIQVTEPLIAIASRLCTNRKLELMEDPDLPNEDNVIGGCISKVHQAFPAKNSYSLASYFTQQVFCSELRLTANVMWP